MNTNFAQVNGQADAVQFEFGSAHRERLAVRQHVLRRQPSLRTLLLLQLAILRYRIEVRWSELDSHIVEAQRRYAGCLRSVYREIAEYLEHGERRVASTDLEEAYGELKTAIVETYGCRRMFCMCACRLCEEHEGAGEQVAYDADSMTDGGHKGPSRVGTVRRTSHQHAAYRHIGSSHHLKEFVAAARQRTDGQAIQEAELSELRDQLQNLRQRPVNVTAAVELDLGTDKVAHAGR